MWTVLLLIPLIWGLYRLVVEGEPGKPALMEMARESHEKEMKEYREKEEFRARASFQVLADRYRNSEIPWETVWETMWMAHPHEMEKWKGEYERQINQTMH